MATPPLLTAPFLRCRKDIAKVTIFYQQLNYQAVNESPLLTVGCTTSAQAAGYLSQPCVWLEDYLQPPGWDGIVLLKEET